MISEEIKLIEYPQKTELLNCLTHAAGAVFSVVALSAMLIKADNIRSVFSALLFGLSLIAVYTVSATYHGLKSGEKKRIARLIDHSAIPFLIAGTASPCALITLYEINIPCSLTVLAFAWFCPVFGLVAKIFFFEKTRTATVAVYIISCFAMISCALPFLEEINSKAFGGILLGCVLYLIGGVFCRIGMKKPAMHVVFHVFCVMASLVHFFVIYQYILFKTVIP